MLFIQRLAAIFPDNCEYDVTLTASSPEHYLGQAISFYCSFGGINDAGSVTWKLKKADSDDYAPLYIAYPQDEAIYRANLGPSEGWFVMNKMCFFQTKCPAEFSQT